VTAALALLATMTTGAAAQARTLGLKGGPDVIVWRDDKAQSEGLSLIAAGVHKSNPGLIVPYIACIVPSGTPAAKVDGGFFSSTIMVTGGKESGCRGVVSNHMFAK
jgi:hypothetical protein